jgi:hypothetical protein
MRGHFPQHCASRPAEARTWCSRLLCRGRSAEEVAQAEACVIAKERYGDSRGDCGGNEQHIAMTEPSRAAPKDVMLSSCIEPSKLHLHWHRYGSGTYGSGTALALTDLSRLTACLNRPSARKLPAK